MTTRDARRRQWWAQLLAERTPRLDVKEWNAMIRIDEVLDGLDQTGVDRVLAELTAREAERRRAMRGGK